jgi:anti-anti-sigma factor
MSVACNKEEGLGVVVLSGPLTAATVEAFREQLAAWQAGEPDVKNFVFDLSGVDFMDSAGLGSLIAALKRITERGGDMKLPAEETADGFRNHPCLQGL